MLYNKLTHKLSQAVRQKGHDRSLKIKNLNLCWLFLQAKYSKSVKSGFSKIEFSYSLKRIFSNPR